MPVKAKYCLHCESPIRGRSDKKFCDDVCRTNYNNNINWDEKMPYVRQINNCLRNNRRILKGLMKGQSNGKKLMITKERLGELGYVTKYRTHYTQSKKNQLYTCCYDFGLLPLDGDRFLIVKME